jgi:hypothetical protein
MAPIQEPNILLGPTSLPKLTKEPKGEGQLEPELRSDLDTATDCVVLFINEANLENCPRIEISISGKFKIKAILDSGSEVNLLSEGVYEGLIKSGLQIALLPVENVLLVTASGRKSKRIRRQALVDFSISQDFFEGVFFIYSQLINEAIIDCQFLMEYRFRINFESGTFSYVRDGLITEHSFAIKAELKQIVTIGG